MEGSVDQERRNVPKYKGVRLRKWGKWVSEVRLPNSRERIWLGSYDTAEKAARAFDAAQFCLRGPNAKFNFPETPPDIPRGQRLSPADIRHFAAQFANSYQQRQEEVALPPHDDIEVMEINSHVIKIDEEEETSLSSTSNNHVGQMNTMDWSFLDMLENYPHASGPSDAPPFSSSSPHPQLPSNESTTNFDFGYYPGLETLSSNLYSPTHFPPRTTYNNDGHENDDMSGNGDENYFQQSFLWNF